MQLRADQINHVAQLLRFHKKATADLISVSCAEDLFRNATEAGIAYVSIHECDAHSRYASFITQVLQDVAPGLWRRQKGLRFEPLVRQVCGNWRAPSDEGDDQVSSDIDSCISDRPTESQLSLASSMDTYKSIRRHLWRHTFKKHQRCIRSAANRLWWHIDGERTSSFCPHALAFIRWRMLWEGCGTPGYLFARKSKDYHGIIGWHLARPSPAPTHWNVDTKAWISRHIFGSTCLVAMGDMQRWADSTTGAGVVTWDLQKSPVSYTCLWAVAGADSRDRPAIVYLRRAGAKEGLSTAPVDPGAHWRDHNASIAQLRR